MSKKLKFIVSGLMFLVLSAVLLTVYFVVGKNDTNINKLSITSENIVMTVDEEKSDFFIVSIENAKIAVSIEDETIVKHDDGKLVALKHGTTIVTVTASFKNETASTSFSVEVVAPTYSYVISPVQGAIFNNGTLYQTSKNVQFIFAVKDEDDENVDYGIVEHSITNPAATFSKEFASYILINEQDCEIKLSFPDIDYEITFAVVVLF